MKSSLGPAGALGVRFVPAPKASVLWKLSNFHNVLKGLWKFELAKLLGIPTFMGTLRMRLFDANGHLKRDYGLVSTRVVTTAFVNEMVDQLQAEDSTWGDFKYHDSGIGTTGAAVGDTDIETTDGQARSEGTQTEGASANIYRTVGTISYDDSYAITEHGVFNASTSGELLDRHTFSAVNVGDGDSIEFTYELTVSAGG